MATINEVYELISFNTEFRNRVQGIMWVVAAQLIENGGGMPTQDVRRWAVSALEDDGPIALSIARYVAVLNFNLPIEQIKALLDGEIESAVSGSIEGRVMIDP